jgi:hypothetical protein
MMGDTVNKQCAMCGGAPFSGSTDPNEPLFCSLECEGNWRKQQREGTFLAALNLTPKATYEAWGDLDLGEPQSAWACAVDRFREEARINRSAPSKSAKMPRTPRDRPSSTLSAQRISRALPMLSNERQSRSQRAPNPRTFIHDPHMAGGTMTMLGRHFPLSRYAPSLLRVSALRASIGAA